MKTFNKEKAMAFEAGKLYGANETRQFILNILDGIDIADKEMGNTGGGTKAIRLALLSRSFTTATRHTLRSATKKTTNR